MINKIEGEITNALGHLRELRMELEDELAAALADIADLRDGIARIDKVIKASEKPSLNGNGPKKSKPKPGAKLVSATPLTLERAETILDLMKKSDVKDWRASDISNTTGLPISSVTNVMAYMRQEGMIRATRKVQGGGNAYATYPA